MADVGNSCSDPQRHMCRFRTLSSLESGIACQEKKNLKHHVTQLNQAGRSNHSLYVCMYTYRCIRLDQHPLAIKTNSLKRVLRKKEKKKQKKNACEPWKSIAMEFQS